MKLGVLTVLFQDRPLTVMLDNVANLGLHAVELGTGAYTSNAHCDPAALLADPTAIKALKHAVARRGLIISALACHGNPLHPNQALAAEHDQVYRDTVRLAIELGVDVVNLFAGCPGDSADSRYPNWVTCAWPLDFAEILRWQWEERVIPYWTEAGRFAEEHGVKLGFEMHPGFVVYNPETLLRLRAAVGTVIGTNYDPSHLFWQGIDPVAAIRALAGTIYHVHAKDTFIDPLNVAVNGVLDTKPYSDLAHRAWIFRTVGYGHDQLSWRGIVSALRLTGYDGVISIEHEDPLVSVDEGLRRAVSFLNDVILAERPSAMWWT
ncbi:MAG: sugar phosphate isomerase/epimerase [Chloroflexales bacterium]